MSLYINRATENYTNDFYTVYFNKIYLSAPNPPKVILKMRAVDHLYPPVQLHGRFFKNFLLPRHSILFFTVQLVL